MLRRLLLRLRPLLGRRRFEDDLDEELRFHLQARAEDLARRGVPAAEARRRARLEFGAADRVKEECREARALALGDTLSRNVRYAVRLLAKSPAFTATAVTTLALCIGVNTAVFSLVDAVLLRPLPYPEPDRLVQIVTAFRGPEGEGTQESLTGRVWEAVRDGVTTVEACVTGSLSGAEVNFASGGRIESVRQQRVSAGFFRVLGISPLVGRSFTLEEDRTGGPAVVVLSHALWSRVFGADERIVGQVVTLRGEPHTVVGVMPAEFVTSSPADVWTPLRPSSTGEGGGSNYYVLARLRPGVSLPRASSEISRISREVMREVDLPRGTSAWLSAVPLQRGLTQNLRTPLLLLWASVAVVLLMGCANIAGLLLARSRQRAREIATRLALGGGRRAVLGQLLTESLVLALLGGAVGVLVGYLVLRGLERLVVESFEVWQEVGLDLRVLGVTAVLTLLTSLLFGLFPALRATRVDLRVALVEAGGRGIAGAAHQWPRRLLVVGETALGVVLLVAAGLLLRTFLSLNAQSPGFDGRGVAMAQASLVDPRYRTAAAISRLFEDSLARIRAIPGVEAAAVGLSLPYERALNLGFARVDGAKASGPSITSVCYVTSDYFRALGIPVRRGRAFPPPDQVQGPPAVVVNEAFARQYFPREEPLGLHLAMGNQTREIVGVVGDVQQQAGWGDFGPLARVPTVYVPASQMNDAGLSLIHTWFSPRWVVRSSLPLAGLAPVMQAQLTQVDPLLPFSAFRTLDDVRAASLVSQRTRATLLGGLAVLAVLLTFVGIYGVIATGVAERRHELGVRLALGATGRQVVGAAAAPGIALAVIGVAIGAGLAGLAVPVLRHLLWGVTVFDPISFAAAGGVLLCASLAGSLVPALRAARVDPSTTLRSD